MYHQSETGWTIMEHETIPYYILNEMTTGTKSHMTVLYM